MEIKRVGGGGRGVIGFGWGFEVFKSFWGSGLLYFSEVFPFVELFQSMIGVVNFSLFFM